VGFISTIASDLSTFLPFEVTVGGYNFFGHPPRVFFMDVIKGKSELNAIHDCLCTGTGLNDPRFSPHVTLARIKYSNTAIHDIINKLPSDNFTWTVNKIVLFESKLTNKGPIYSVYEEFPLKAL
jgi:2'-5' RNA ligase